MDVVFTLEQVRDFRREWINYLRSGSLSQAKEVLANEDYSAFCCLGVAEDKIGPLLPDEVKICRLTHGVFGLRNPYYDDRDPYLDEFIEADTELHTVLRHALGLSIEQQGILISLNDDLGVDFYGISVVAEKMNFYVNGKVYSCYGTLTNPDSEYF